MFAEGTWTKGRAPESDELIIDTGPPGQGGAENRDGFVISDCAWDKGRVPESNEQLMDFVFPGSGGPSRIKSPPIDGRV